MHDFEIYTGRGTCKDYGLGFSGDIVMHLSSNLPDNQNFKLFFDNWFSSIRLAISLKNRGIFSLGTIRKNRIGNCPLMPDKEMKNIGRGAFDFKVNISNSICITKWYDNSFVILISTFCGTNPVETCQRFSKQQKKYIEIQQPKVVAEYNKYMGAVDLMDMLIELYRINIKSKKWYMRIILWSVNVAVVNAWLLYRRHQLQKGLNCEFNLLQFQLYIAQTLILRDKSNQRKRGRPGLENPSPSRSSPPKRTMTVQPTCDVRYDNMSHYPNYNAKKNRCKFCKTGYTKMTCTKCNIWLCLTPKKNCFLQYHTKKTNE